MQIKETLNGSLLGESAALEDVVILADSAGVALGAPQTFSSRVCSIRHEVSGLVTSRWVEIPLVGGDGEISGVLYQTASRFDDLRAHRPEGIGVIEDVAKFVVHDINNLFAVIGSGLRLLECQDDAAYLAASAAVVVALAVLSRSRVYILSPYILLGLTLWVFVHASGLHATLSS